MLLRRKPEPLAPSAPEFCPWGAQGVWAAQRRDPGVDSLGLGRTRLSGPISILQSGEGCSPCPSKTQILRLGTEPQRSPRPCQRGALGVPTRPLQTLKMWAVCPLGRLLLCFSIASQLLLISAGPACAWNHYPHSFIQGETEGFGSCLGYTNLRWREKETYEKYV